MNPANKKHGDPEQARAAFLAAIETQIRSNDPPETKQTLDRLMKEGFSREESMKYIACALIGELFGILKNESKYDHARYVANLKRLPKRPWDAE
jgi:peroxiredoxin family protein